MLLRRLKSHKTSKVLYSLSGSGTETTRNFTTPDSGWKLDYSWNCSNFSSTPTIEADGILSIIVSQNGTGSMAALEDGPVSKSGASGSGTTNYHYGGKLYLKIDSECTWTVKAVS